MLQPLIHQEKYLKSIHMMEQPTSQHQPLHQKQSLDQQSPPKDLTQLQLPLHADPLLLFMTTLMPLQLTSLTIPEQLLAQLLISQEIFSLGSQTQMEVLPIQLDQVMSLKFMMLTTWMEPSLSIVESLLTLKSTIVTISLPTSHALMEQPSKLQLMLLDIQSLQLMKSMLHNTNQTRLITLHHQN